MSGMRNTDVADERCTKEFLPASGLRDFMDHDEKVQLTGSLDQF